MIGGLESGEGEPPLLERVILPERHEFEVTVPDGATVHGYVTSYEVWDQFVRVNVTFIDRPLRTEHRDVLVLRLADGTFAKMVQGSGGGSPRFTVMGAAFVRPPVAQTVTVGLGRGRREADAPPRVSRHSGEVLGSMRPARGDADILFTPIMDLQLP
jgi:hypothetical protein